MELSAQKQNAIQKKVGFHERGVRLVRLAADVSLAS